jgi:ubiquinone/menaquinone biosynthesis C-methylase UbiE
MTLQRPLCNPSRAGDAISIGSTTFRLISKGIVRGISVGMAIHEGMWLGLLRENSLQKVTADCYARDGVFGSEEHNRRGLLNWEQAAIERFFPTRSKVVIAAAGGGREALAMVAQGFDVVAFDPDARLIEQCRKRLTTEQTQRLTLMPAPPNAVPAFAHATFDAGIVGWGALTHMTSSAVRMAFLRSFAALLKPGAPALISFHLRPPQSRADSLREAIAKGVAAITFGRQPQPGDRFRIEETSSFLHLFTPEEVKTEIESSGFSVTHFAATPEAHVVAIRNQP